jgi:hypothetical protein
LPVSNFPPPTQKSKGFSKHFFCYQLHASPIWLCENFFRNPPWMTITPVQGFNPVQTITHINIYICANTLVSQNSIYLQSHVTPSLNECTYLQTFVSFRHVPPAPKNKHSRGCPHGPASRVRAVSTLKAALFAFPSVSRPMLRLGFFLAVTNMSLLLGLSTVTGRFPLNRVHTTEHGPYPTRTMAVLVH